MKHFSLRKSRPSQNTSAVRPASGQDPISPRQDAPDTPVDPTVLFGTTRDEAIAYGEELTNAITADLRQGELSQLAALWEMVPFYTGVVATAKFAIAQVNTPPPRPCEGLIPAHPGYVISSRFLSECHNYLTGDPRGFERMHLVTGIQLGEQYYTLDQMEHVAMSRQSLGGAAADQQALTRALIEMDSFGHHLHGLFHSHPGSGPRATFPSDIDFTTHRRFEDGGYPLIGAIFVKGYVRFFSTDQPFTITIYGKGVTPVSGDEHVYQIENLTRPVSYETSDTEDGR